MMPPEIIVAKFYQQSGDRENGKKWTAKALAASPDNLRVRVVVGRAAMASGDMDEARKQAIAATQLDPKSIEAKELRGSIAMLEKDYDSAELIFEAALKLQPDNFSLRNNLSLSLIEQKDETKRRRALEYTEANVKKYPNSPEAASSHALVLYRLGRLDDAEKAIRGAAPLLGIDVDMGVHCVSNRRRSRPQGSGEAMARNRAEEQGPRHVPARCGKAVGRVEEVETAPPG